ncbi:hypothetical protein CLOSTMETH_02994 [[Clostridium] methylpentosum DSM 5476]|uniref:Uncharacterized protein n=1 Tax=[Clostridium] methylpentosum DSM 5476 TaxID=537013 RepID=C0EGK1_9FIRM|nr:hypothetical protein CLOSTMETH_02994 [[Clostridium] methylpentosum DSM 5476]
MAVAICFQCTVCSPIPQWDNVSICGDFYGGLHLAEKLPEIKK